MLALLQLDSSSGAHLSPKNMIGLAVRSDEIRTPQLDTPAFPTNVVQAA